MKQLLFKGIIITALVISSYMLILYVIFFHTPYENYADYMSAILDKVNLAETSASPKIIFIGGSNIAFGLDSEQIEKTLGLRVVNMGLHAAVGLKYTLDSARPYINPEDIVVVVPEYAQFYQNSFYGAEQLLNILHIYPQGWNVIRTPEQFLVILKYGSLLIKKKIFLPIDKPSELNPIYSRKAFNRYGDVTSHLNEISSVLHPKPEVKSNKKVIIFQYYKRFNETVLSELQDFNRYVQDRKATLLFIFPCLKETVYDQNNSIQLTVYDKIRQSNIRTYSSPEDYVFPDSYFFDTEYHLDTFGTRIRTDKVIKELKKLQNDVTHMAEYHPSSSSVRFRLAHFFDNLIKDDTFHRVELDVERVKEPLPDFLWKDRWTDKWISNRARCSFRLSKEQKEVVVEGNVTNYTIPSSLIVKRNNKTIKEVSLNRPGKFSFGLELSSPDDHTIVDLEFNAEKTFNPRVLGLSNDSRNLGVQLEILRQQ